VQPGAAGQYTYNRTGKATTSAFGEQSMDGQITARFDPVANGEQHSAQQAPEGSTEQSLRFLSEGAYFTLLKQATSGFTKEFRPNPAVLALPASPSPSSPWSWTVTSTDGKTTLNAAFKVLRNESVAIGGESVPTVVLSVQLKASGDITFTQNATDWVAMAKGLIVKNEQTTDGSLGGVTFHSQSSQVLQSTKPA
jgi:hypothetical protein